MHELHLAEDILRKIIEKAGGGKKVKEVRIALGQSRFTHLEELKEILADIAKGTVAAGAKFEFEIVPVKAACGACGAEFTAEKLRLDCEKCGSTDIQLTSGNQLEVIDVKN
jgi:hydrogenase nickel insertion protein HypA